MKNVMVTAWEIARRGKKKHGGKVTEYFSKALKIAWSLFKKEQQRHDYNTSMIKYHAHVEKPLNKKEVFYEKWNDENKSRDFIGKIKEFFDSVKTSIKNKLAFF